MAGLIVGARAQTGKLLVDMVDFGGVYQIEGGVNARIQGYRVGSDGAARRI
jgi:hypothetical protein